MTLLQPQTDQALVDTSESEALIKEARRLRRRRWAIGLLVAAVVGTGIGWALASSGHQPATPTARATGHKVIRGDPNPGLPVGHFANLTVAGPLAVAPSGALYIADTNRQRVLVRLPDGRFRSVAGNGTKGVSGDGEQAIDAEFLDIEDMTVGPDGSLYILDGDRVRVVGRNGVISTVAGVPGMGATAPCCPSALPQPIANGTPALSVSIDQLNSAAIALSEQGTLYISTGMQLLRLDAGALDVITTKAMGPPFNGQPLNDPGQIALDAQGNLDVSGGNGWAIWLVAPNGIAKEVSSPNARRSGGNTSVLERAPDGLVYGESGSTFLELEGGRAVPGYSFPQRPGSGFWLTYFAFGPTGTVYADEIPGGEAWEKYQQLRVVRDGRSSLLWQQSAADVPPAQS